MDEKITITYSAQSIRVVKTHILDVESTDSENGDYPVQFKLCEIIEGHETYWEFDEDFAPEDRELEWAGVTESDLIKQLKLLTTGSISSLTLFESEELDD